MTMKVVLAAASVIGCSQVGVQRWSAPDREGVVAAKLCDVCESPYDYQSSAAAEMMRKKCGSDYSVLEEGVTSRDGVAASTIAGKYASYSSVRAERAYFWAFRCTK
jgi:hypothetical protein